MKKTIWMILLILCFGVVMTSSLAAERIEVTPGGKNLLNLSTIYKTENDTNGYSDKSMIKLIVGETYTLVMDYDYAAQCNSNLIEFEYENAISGHPYYATYQFDETHQRIYAEFVAADEYISIVSVPVPEGSFTSNYNIMLYQGDYSDFSGYEPYVSETFLFEETGSLSMDYDDLMSTEDIYLLISAKDAEGNNIAKNVVIDTYSESDKKPGDYEIVFQAESNLIERTYTLNISVYDNTSPVITGPDTLQYDISDRPSTAEIAALYTITDNVDEDISIVKGTDTYTYASSLGTYWIYFSATDSSGNESVKHVAIELIDTTPPVLHGPLDLYIYTTDVPFSDADIIETYRATDTIDGVCEVTISANDYQQTKEVGIYEIVMSASDQQNNTSTRSIYIHVIDNRGPSFDVNELIIDTTPEVLLSSDDVITQFITHMAAQEIKMENIDIMYNEYETHETEVGEYYVYVSYDVDGVTETSRILVSVVDEGAQFSPYYLFGVVPIIGLIAFIFFKKRPW